MPAHFRRTRVAVILPSTAPFAIGGTLHPPTAPAAAVATAAADPIVEEIFVLRSIA
jgi:hypothetical protein